MNTKAITPRFVAIHEKALRQWADALASTPGTIVAISRKGPRLLGALTRLGLLPALMFERGARNLLSDYLPIWIRQMTNLQQRQVAIAAWVQRVAAADAQLLGAYAASVKSSDRYYFYKNGTPLENDVVFPNLWFPDVREGNILSLAFEPDGPNPVMTVGNDDYPVIDQSWPPFAMRPSTLPMPAMAAAAVAKGASVGINSAWAGAWISEYAAYLAIAYAAHSGGGVWPKCWHAGSLHVASDLGAGGQQSLTNARAAVSEMVKAVIQKVKQLPVY